MLLRGSGTRFLSEKAHVRSIFEHLTNDENRRAIQPKDHITQSGPNGLYFSSKVPTNPIFFWLTQAPLPIPTPRKQAYKNTQNMRVEGRMCLVYAHIVDCI